VNEQGEYEQTTDRRTLLRYFSIEKLSRERDNYGQTRPKLRPFGTWAQTVAPKNRSPGSMNPSTMPPGETAHYPRHHAGHPLHHLRYNLRGLAPSGLCRNAARPIQRSIDARMKLIMSSPRIWAGWCSAGWWSGWCSRPISSGAAFLAGYAIGESTSPLPYVNYPGPKVWAVHLLHRVN